MSVKKIGIIICSIFLLSVVFALFGVFGASLSLLAVGLASMLYIVQVLEHRRHAAHQKQTRNLLALRKSLSEHVATQQRCHDLVVREIRSLSNVISNESSDISSQNEKVLAIYLRALNIAKADILVEVPAVESAANVGRSR